MASQRDPDPLSDRRADDDIDRSERSYAPFVILGLFVALLGLFFLSSDWSTSPQQSPRNAEVKMRDSQNEAQMTRPATPAPAETQQK